MHSGKMRRNFVRLRNTDIVDINYGWKSLLIDSHSTKTSKLSL